MGKFKDWFFGDMYVNNTNNVKNEVQSAEIDITQDTTISFFKDDDDYSGSISEKDAMSIPSFASCCDLICSNIAYLPIKMYKTVDGEKVEITDDYRVKLLNTSCNQFDSSFNLLYGMAKNLALYGVAYVYIEKDKRNNIKGLYFLNSKDVSPQLVKLPNGKYDYTFSFSHFQDFKKVDSDEMLIANRDLSSSYDIDGVGVLEKGAKILNLALEEVNNSSNALGNRLNAFLSTPNSLSPQAKANIRSSFKGLTASKNNQIPIFEEGLTYSTVSLKPQDLELLDSRRYTAENICSLFNIPFTYVLASATSYQNSAHESIRFIKSLTPYLTAIEKAFQRYLLTQKEIDAGVYFEFDVTKLLKISTQEMGDYLKSMVQSGLMTQNEARKSLGLPAIEGADALFIPVNTYQLIEGKISLPSMEQEQEEIKEEVKEADVDIKEDNKEE